MSTFETWSAAVASPVPNPAGAAEPICGAARMSAAPARTIRMYLRMVFTSIVRALRRQQAPLGLNCR
jgi:hypothetical protein